MNWQLSGRTPKAGRAGSILGKTIEAAQGSSRPGPGIVRFNENSLAPPGSFVLFTVFNRRPMKAMQPSSNSRETVMRFPTLI
jgi:hypothetical protein